MKIAVDISQIVYAGTGVARHARNLVEALLAFDKNNRYVFFFSSLRRKINKEIEKQIQSPHKLKKYPFPPTLLDWLWNRVHIIPIDNFVGKADLIITSDWTEPPSDAKKITIVHDLVFLKFPETLPQKIIDVQKRRLHWVKKESNLIVADSQSTKNDLISLVHLPPDKIDVVYPALAPHPRGGIPLTSRYTKDVLNKYGLTKRFILTVGKQEPRKNLTRLVTAFKKTKLQNVDLVIAGPKGWKDYQEKISDVRYLGHVTDDELSVLYASALFFVYPSVYEGFGYPVVEAMSMGCPVATSNSSSLKEIAGDNGLLFNPYSTTAISQALARLSQDEELRRELGEKGLKRALDFSQRKLARQFLAVFDKVYDNRR